MLAISGGEFRRFAVIVAGGHDPVVLPAAARLLEQAVQVAPGVGDIRRGIEGRGEIRESLRVPPEVNLKATDVDGPDTLVFQAAHE
jgi:hypothetical protein